MKYIKVYEDYDQPMIDNDWEELEPEWLESKYVLYRTNSKKMYFILEITGYEPKYIAAKKLYIYNMETEILRKGKHQYYNISYDRIKDIMFKSDNLKEVKDAIKTLKNYNKFNI